MTRARQDTGAGGDSVNAVVEAEVRGVPADGCGVLWRGLGVVGGDFSGAVLLLPVQLDVLRVPSPASTPTNLLFNVIAFPGALLRHHRVGRLGGSLARQMLPGRSRVWGWVH